jgi:hypothetical protein
MTEGPTGAMFPVLRHGLKGEKKRGSRIPALALAIASFAGMT